VDLDPAAVWRRVADLLAPWRLGPFFALESGIHHQCAARRCILTTRRTVFIFRDRYQHPIRHDPETRQALFLCSRLRCAPSGPDAKVDFVTIAEAFRSLTAQLDDQNRTGEAKPAFILAELNDLLTAAAANQFELLARPPIHDPYLANYVAAMVEQAAHFLGVLPPAWTSGVAPLSQPVFAVPWPSLRAHLLLESPVPFRRRNIFIDSSIGARV
jgi:hypothetical protein